MQYEVSVPPLNMAHDMTTTGHYASQNLYVPTGASRIKSENSSDRGVSPHPSDQSSRYSSHTPLAYQQIASQLTNSMRYPSPSQLSQQNSMPLQHSYLPNGPQDAYQQQPHMGSVAQAIQQQDQVSVDGSRTMSGSGGLPKAFACTTCQKRFARRSDLARHERIHSGVRPHVCEHPGCGKQFIQRSALTVHSRVHTGEKPHMCERCGKPFSDSSSLARHRRIHSGKRPYKCPYADCQKTFTRRTTLTRHQNHHTGTIEESEAATAAALASRVSMAGQRSRGSDEENEFSADGRSPMPSQPDRPSSVSPASAMDAMSALPRQTSDYYMTAMHGGMAAVPAHLRTEMQTSRSHSPSQYAMSNGQQQRPGLTSNPSAGYNPPPPTMEPPTHNGQQQRDSGSSSPHISATMGWTSPHITSNQQNDYTYGDPHGAYTVSNVNNVNANQIYYQPNGQCPQSTGPMDYGIRGSELWAQPHQ